MASLPPDPPSDGDAPAQPEGGDEWWSRTEDAAGLPVESALGDDPAHHDPERTHSAPPPPTPTQRTVDRRAQRRKWRRRRRVFGTLAFLAVVAVLVYVIAQATGVGESDDAARETTSSTASTTTTLPPAGPYRVIDGLNARSGPGSTFPTVGTIEIGRTVLVVCVAEGELVNGPTGQSTKWLKVTTPFGEVFVTAAYVSVGADLTNPAKIAPCAA